MRILVTGLKGFTGNYLKLELERRGNEVIGLSSDLSDSRSVAIEIKNVKPDEVIHLAGVSFIDNKNPNDFYQVNLIGTRNLLAALALYVPNIKSILLVSSANVYGNNIEGILDEDAVPSPTNDYAVSKLAMEKMAHLWMDQLPIFIVRPFNYTGIGQNVKFLIPKIISHFREKKNIIELGNLEIWREFGDVRSVVGVYSNLIKVRPSGETFNVCTGKAHSILDVVKLCEKITHQKMKININSNLIRSNEVRLLAGNDSKLSNLISNQNLYNLEDTLRWMLKG
jgi:GDP-6-deoxy-D-talose 4-dehydrogenase